jgi:hypothetical protein
MAGILGDDDLAIMGTIIMAQDSPGSNCLLKAFKREHSPF